MARYLLDTNHLSPLVTVGHALRERIFSSLKQGDEFFVPAPALTEFLFGIKMARRSASNLQEWQRIQDSFRCIAVDRIEAEGAAELQVLLRRIGWQLATVDALIATLAMRNELILLTTDGDFRIIRQLALENWITS
jgi:predicted nucleic acid-binding protein